MTTEINTQGDIPVEEPDRGLVEVQNELGTNPSLAEDTNVPCVAAGSDNVKLKSKSNIKTKKGNPLTVRAAKDRNDTCKLV